MFFATITMNWLQSVATMWLALLGTYFIHNALIPLQLLMEYDLFILSTR